MGKTDIGLDDLRYTEGFAWDPFKMAIVSPAPPKDIKIEITAAVGEIPEQTYTFGYKDIVGPNDSHERGIGWDPTFMWAQQSEAVKRDFERHVVALLNGHLPKTITVHHQNGMPFPVVVEARHTVFAQRVANLIRKKLKITPLANLAFRRKKFSEVAAAITSYVGNKSYDRDKAAEIEKCLELIELNGWNDKEAAEYFGKGVSTIKAWRLKSQGRRSQTGETRVRSGLKKPQQKKLFNVLKGKDYPDEWAQIAELILTGELPKDASPAIKQAWKAVQS